MEYIQMNTLTNQVQHAAALMSQEAQLDDDTVVDRLKKDGYAQLFAVRLSVFVPHAFGRVLLQTKHYPTFSSCFLLERSDGIRIRVRFRREPIMATAAKLARDWMATDEDRFLQVAHRGSEVDAARQIPDWRAGPMPIEFCEPVIVGIDLCEYGPHLAAQPWWKFW